MQNTDSIRVDWSISIIKRTLASIDTELVLDIDAWHYLNAYSKDIENLCDVIFIEIKKTNKLGKKLIRITRKCLEEGIIHYKGNEQKRNINQEKVKSAIEFIDKIEESLIVLKNEVDTTKTKITVEMIACKLQTNSFIGSVASDNVKQFLYNKRKELRSECIEILKSTDYKDKWVNARKLLMFKRLI